MNETTEQAEAGFRYFFTAFLNCLSEEAYLFILTGNREKLSRNGDVREDMRLFRVSSVLMRKLKAYSEHYPLARFKDIMLEGYAAFISSYRFYTKQLDEQIFKTVSNTYPESNQSLWSVWVVFLAEKMEVDISAEDLRFLEVD